MLEHSPLFVQDGCRRMRTRGDRGVMSSLVGTGRGLRWQEWCCVWASVKGKGGGGGMMGSTVNKSVFHLVCVSG